MSYLWSTENHLNFHLEQRLMLQSIFFCLSKLILAITFRRFDIFLKLKSQKRDKFLSQV